MIHRVKATFYINNWGARLTIVMHSEFSVIAGLVVDMLFMLFSVYYNV